MRGTTNARQPGGSNLTAGDWIEISNDEISVKASPNTALIIESETSDLYVPTQKAVKTYVDNMVGSIETALRAINGSTPLQAELDLQGILSSQQPESSNEVIDQSINDLEDILGNEGE